MKTKHTQGPWTFDNVNMKIKGSGDVEGMTVIANVSPKMDYSRGMSTQCANAKLIAAAPELLNQLFKSRKLLIENGFHTWSYVIIDIDSAIKKATE